MNISNASSAVDIFDLDTTPETTAAKSAAETRPNEEEILAKRRLEKIQQYLKESLDQEDVWRGCMGPVICDLLEMCQRLKSEIDEELKEENSLVAAFAYLEPAVNAYLRIVRQIERLSKINYRIRGIDKKKPHTAI